jgi:hypothetical protein
MRKKLPNGDTSGIDEAITKLDDSQDSSGGAVDN